MTTLTTLINDMTDELETIVHRYVDDNFDPKGSPEPRSIDDLNYSVGCIISPYANNCSTQQIVDMLAANSETFFEVMQEYKLTISGPDNLLSVLYWTLYRAAKRAFDQDVTAWTTERHEAIKQEKLEAFVLELEILAPEDKAYLMDEGTHLQYLNQHESETSIKQHSRQRKLLDIANKHGVDISAIIDYVANGDTSVWDHFYA